MPAPTGLGIPTLIISPDPSLENVLRWLRLGAADVRTEISLEAVRAVQVGPMVQHFLAWAQRVALDGQLRVLVGTPLEGQCTFQQGQLHRASFCWLEQEAALAEMLAMEDAELALEAPMVSRPRAFAPRVLVVEDDETARRLLCGLLAREGYRVFEAADGLAGYEIAQRQRLDAVVSDLDLPRLDGWGLLRLFRDDPVLREVPVVLLSAYEGAVDVLKAARAGARAYLKKTGRSRELLDARRVARAPREGERRAGGQGARRSVAARDPRRARPQWSPRAGRRARSLRSGGRPGSAAAGRRADGQPAGGGPLRARGRGHLERPRSLRAHRSP